MLTAEARQRVLEMRRAHGGSRPGAGRKPGPPGEPCRDCGTRGGFRVESALPPVRIPVSRFSGGVAGVVCWSCVRRRVYALAARPKTRGAGLHGGDGRAECMALRGGMGLEVVPAVIGQINHPTGFAFSDLTPAAAARLAVREYDRTRRGAANLNFKDGGVSS